VLALSAGSLHGILFRKVLLEDPYFQLPVMFEELSDYVACVDYVERNTLHRIVNSMYKRLAM